MKNAAIFVAVLVATAVAFDSDVVEEDVERSMAAPVPSKKSSVIKTSLACSVSDHVHSVLFKFEATAANEVEVTTAVLATKKGQYVAQKAVTVKATADHSSAAAAMAKAKKEHAKCVGVQKTFTEELAVQKPIIANELSCIASIKKSVAEMGDVPADEEAEADLEVPEEFADTRVAGAVNVLLERRDGVTGKTIKELNALLDGFSAKLKRELQSLQDRLAAQIKKCEGLSAVKEAKISAHAVALSERTLQEKNLAVADKNVRDATAVRNQVISEREEEVAVTAQVRSSTTRVCKGKKVDTEHSICSSVGLITEHFAARKQEHATHVAQRNSFKTKMDVEQSDLGRATVKRDAARVTFDEESSSLSSCVAALKTKKAELDNSRRVVGRERELIAVIRKKAACVKDISEDRKHDCSKITAALEELKESSATDATELAMIEMERDDATLGEVEKLLKTLDDALIKELAGFQTRFDEQTDKCSKQKKVKESALVAKVSAEAAHKQATADFASAKSDHDAYVMTLKQFVEELETETAAFKKAQVQLTTLAKTKYGMKWAGCTSTTEADEAKPTGRKPKRKL